jgi:transposase
VVPDTEQGALGAYLRRQRSRLGVPKAITATAHKLGRIVYRLIKHGEAYVARQEGAHAEEVRRRQEKHLHRRARDPGYAVVKIEPETASDPAPEGAAGEA